MTKSEMEVLKAIVNRTSLPKRGLEAGHHTRHSKAMSYLKSEGIIYMDNDSILHIKRHVSD